MPTTENIFMTETMEQVLENRAKWGEADADKDHKDFVLIAQEQLGQLSNLSVENDVFGMYRETIHTVAILYELFRRLQGL